ncbi:hypothetical protein HY641_01870 [Candidatus Woesearchaeota archaeon]|nr:hypothetical protein [Candidatus Woesearchaeota archaeon]
MRPGILDERGIKFLGYAGKVSAQMPLFYNPAMQINRDMAVLLLKAWGEEELQVCDPLAGTGIRSLRFLKECAKQIRRVDANDVAPSFMASMKWNIKRNGVASSRISISSQEASVFLLQSSGYDYIEIDPFGSPNPFLDAAIRRLSRRGMLAVTATDTAALAGTYPAVCKRKYWADPLHQVWMHEVGVRILIRKVQLIASQYDRGLRPVLSYADQHYVRVFFRSQKGKSSADEVLALHGAWRGAGPMWLGDLWDESILRKMRVPNDWTDAARLIEVLHGEASVPIVGFHDIHDLASRHRQASLPRMDVMFARLKSKGYRAARTHFSGVGIRTDADEDVFIRLMQ